jgi:hypothetical protein
MSFFDFEEPTGGTEDKSSQQLRDPGQNIEQGEQTNWSGRLCACTGLLGQETTRHIMELRIQEEEAPPHPREMAPAQHEIGAKTVDETEPSGKVQVPPQGPPTIKRRAIAVQKTVAGGIAPRLTGSSNFQQALDKLKGCLDNDIIIKQELD